MTREEIRQALEHERQRDVYPARRTPEQREADKTRLAWRLAVAAMEKLAEHVDQDDPAIAAMFDAFDAAAEQHNGR